MKKTMLLASAAMIGVGFLAAHVKAQAVPEKDNLEQNMIAPSSEAEVRRDTPMRAPHLRMN